MGKVGEEIDGRSRVLTGLLPSDQKSYQRLTLGTRYYESIEEACGIKRATCLMNALLDIERECDAPVVRGYD